MDAVIGARLRLIGLQDLRFLGGQRYVLCRRGSIHL